MGISSATAVLVQRELEFFCVWVNIHKKGEKLHEETKKHKSRRKSSHFELSPGGGQDCGIQSFAAGKKFFVNEASAFASDTPCVRRDRSNKDT